MKIGLVVTTPAVQLGSIRAVFELVKSLGYEGIGFRSLLQLSEGLVPDILDDVRSIAAHFGLFLNFGLGWLNPFTALTRPEVWALGEGDYCLAVRRQLEAACRLGCTEMVGEIAGVKGPYRGRYAFDRFRSDVPWAEQLRLSKNFLLKIRPVLKDLGMRINLENHEDLTSRELLRLVERVGPDVLGVTLDAANLPVLGEDPVAGAVRLAPIVHLAHVKDIFLSPAEKGFLRQIRPAGEGVISWEKILPALFAQDPKVKVLVEDHKGIIQIDAYDPAWRSHFPELMETEIAELAWLAARSRERVQKGEIEAPELYEEIPYPDQKESRLRSALAYLKQMRDQFSLWDSPAEVLDGGPDESWN